jgi:hypothetical protein
MITAQTASIVTAVVWSSMAAGASDPLVGTWLLSVEESRIRGGMRVTIERRGGAFRYSSAGVEFTALFDGDDYPIRGVSSHATVSLKRVDEHTIERIYKRDGNPVSGATLTVSPDGRFLTVKIRRLGVESAAQQWTNTYQKVPGSSGMDRFAGIWERNPIRSLGNSLSTLTFELLEGGTLRFRADQVEYSAPPDAHTHKVIGTIVADSVSLKRINSRTLEEVWKDSGEAVATVLRVLSEDGNNMTATATGITPQGERFENVYVYRRKPLAERIPD